MFERKKVKENRLDSFPVQQSRDNVENKVISNSRTVVNQCDKRESSRGFERGSRKIFYSPRPPPSLEALKYVTGKYHTHLTVDEQIG